MLVEILRCPRHPSFLAVTIDGYRITPSKCCGTWDVVKTWNKGCKMGRGMIVEEEINRLKARLTALEDVAELARAAVRTNLNEHYFSMAMSDLAKSLKRLDGEGSDEI